MNKFRQRIAELSAKNKSGDHESQSLVYLALSDSFSPLFGSFCAFYNLNSLFVDFEDVINGLWKKWIESARIDTASFGKRIEMMTPNLERFTDRTACYAQDACILAHAACSLLDSPQDIDALSYYMEPFEEVAQKESALTLELPGEKWEEDILLKDSRVQKAFHFIEQCVNFASILKAPTADSCAAFRRSVGKERWTLQELHQTI